MLHRGAGASSAVVGSRLQLRPDSRARCCSRLPPGPPVQMGPGLFCAIDPGPQYWTVVTSMFMHGGWMHLIGNMVFFWVFGNNIEDAMGHVAVRDLLPDLRRGGGRGAGVPHPELDDPDGRRLRRDQRGARRVPAALPAVRVHALLPLGFYITTIALPAYVMLGYWILLQVLSSLAALGSAAERGHRLHGAHRRLRGGTRVDPAVRETRIPGAASRAPGRTRP